MKILYIVTQSEIGGAQKYVCELALNLSKENEVFVAAGPSGNWQFFDYLLNKIKVDQIISIIKLKNLVRDISLLKNILGLFEILDIIRKIKPDIVHLNSSMVGFCGAIAAKLVGVKRVIFTAHGWVFNEPMNIIKKYFYIFLSWLSALFQDKIICVSEYDRQLALKRKIAPSRKLITIHNGIDIDSLNILPKDKARKELRNIIRNGKINFQGFLIGTIANLYKTKGLNYLIKAIRLLYNDYKLPTKPQFLIIGEGDERYYLEKLIKDFGLEDKVFLVGFIENSARYLKAFDFFVLPSVKEGLPYTLLEAMAAGLLIVATRVGGVSEIITDKSDGFLIESQNERALANKIFDLIQDVLYDENINEVKEQAKNKIKREFSLARMIEETKKVYFVN